MPGHLSIQAALFTGRAHRVLAPCSFCLPAIRIVRQTTFFIQKVFNRLLYHSNIKLKQSKTPQVMTGIIFLCKKRIRGKNLYYYYNLFL